ncbi:hypothetical protein AVEN_186428-1 [Araneus ventricosus]|uniref:Uncharacterized protein n=1 Tax=Araneus ventricosus TaxID=182803 RepID=A0A4Y2AJT6_ARAVE|nr:hypothetical protein AVEN_104084-1 [Araneus ventricosus]GBL79539.1 hypothetical protein AVEN_161103-1 [Araneus ventricosus]GBL79553.1 hypothetical protein AVEN_173800-1 [Araneus ventricosus]GBL79572.1 hypothetical protein AVEN_186428-1 [Araneus ventricosus]
MAFSIHMQDPKLVLLVMAPCYRMIHLIKPSSPTNIKRSKVWNSRYQVFEHIWDYLGSRSAAEKLILEHIWDYLGSQSAAEKLILEHIWDYLGSQSAAEKLILEHIWNYLGSQSAAEKLIPEMYNLEGHLPGVWTSLRIQVTGELILNIERRCQECISFL